MAWDVIWGVRCVHGPDGDAVEDDGSGDRRVECRVERACQCPVSCVRVSYDASQWRESGERQGRIYRILITKRKYLSKLTALKPISHLRSPLGAVHPLTCAPPGGQASSEGSGHAMRCVGHTRSRRASFSRRSPRWVHCQKPARSCKSRSAVCCSLGPLSSRPAHC